MSTQAELQSSIDAALKTDGAVVSEHVDGGLRYSTVAGALIGVVDDSQADKETAARAAIDGDKKFLAKCISDLAFRLSKAPSALSAAEILAERDRIAAIYKDM